MNAIRTVGVAFARLALAGLVGALGAGGAAIAQTKPVQTQATASALLHDVQFAPRPGSEPRIRGGVQGRFDYYALVMSWSPTFCATANRPDETQCNRRDGRRFAFVLHGLWPQYERGYPEFCPTQDRPFVSEGTINRMFDIMPSRGLIIHEYKKHGVCTGLGPDGYFDIARQMFGKVKVPARFQNPDQNQMVDTDAIVTEFAAANPGLKPDMLAVVCGGPGNRLREVRVCFTQDGQFRPCGSNERRTCSAPRVFVPLVRSSPAGATGEKPAPPRMQPGPMLPGPTLPGQRSL